MDGFTLSDDQRALREVAAKVAADVYAPVATEWDLRREVLPPEEVRRLADLGFLGIALPEEYGGAGGTLVDALIVIEELAKVCRPAAFQVFEANVGPAQVVAHLGSPELKTKYLPGVISGEL